MGTQTRSWLIRLVLASSFAVALAFVPAGVEQGHARRELERLRARLADTRARRDRLRAENRRLRLEVRGLAGDPRAIEDRARRDLGMVYPGELVIQLEDEPRDGRDEEAR